MILRLANPYLDPGIASFTLTAPVAALERAASPAST